MILLMFHSILLSGPDSVDKYMAEKPGVGGESKKNKPANCVVVFHGWLNQGESNMSVAHPTHFGGIDLGRN